MKNFEEQFLAVAEATEKSLANEMGKREVSQVTFATADNIANGTDPIWALVYEDGTDNIVKRIVVGLKLDDDGGLEVVALPQYVYNNDVEELSYTDEDGVVMYEDFELIDYEEYTYPLFGGDLLGAFTAYNLAERYDWIVETIKEQA